ncbi:MAG TPA: hypothetical protein VGE85_08015 [Terracidiphilus sp.]|jgi:hypothetical protein
MGMKPVGEIGVKITSAQREYFRYTGASAEVERRGAGSSRPNLAWVRRQQQEEEERSRVDQRPARAKSAGSKPKRSGGGDELLQVR